MDITVRTNDWRDPAWLAAAHEWITVRLAALRTPATGPIEEVRARPWSVIHRVPTASGPRWFKANTMDCTYEAGLAEALARWLPGTVLEPLAVDAARGWLLTADAGHTLRETLAASRRLEGWAEMLRAYALLQRAVAPRADDLAALGVPDLRTPSMPDHLASLLVDPAVRTDLGPRAAAVEGAAPAFGDWCADLAADGIPASLQHDDLTDANVFPTAAGGFRFFDWGDASVAHPFGSLLVALSFAAHVLDLKPGAPELARLRDAYLEPWSDLATPEALRRSVTLACRIGRVSRALAWRRALRGAALPVADDFRTAAADWLAELPEPTVI